MIGNVTIKNLVVRSKIGITEEERAFPQDLVINIVLSVNIDEALVSDDIKDTTDYFKLYGLVVEFAGTSKFNLIESLANSLADVCILNSNCIDVGITIEKPHILMGAESAGFSLIKIRNE